jgi:hypothetical protein
LESSLAKLLDLYPLLAGRLVPLSLGKFQIEYNQEDLLVRAFVVGDSRKRKSERKKKK